MEDNKSDLIRVSEELAILLKEYKSKMDPYKFAALLADCNDVIKRESGIDYGATCSSHCGSC